MDSSLRISRLYEVIQLEENNVLGILITNITSNSKISRLDLIDINIVAISRKKNKNKSNRKHHQENL